MTPHSVDSSPYSRDEWLQTEVITGGDGVPVRLVVAGEIERGTCGRLRHIVADIVRTQAPVQLRIDAAKVSFLDSAGLRCLLLCRDEAQSAGTRVFIVDPAPLVAWALGVAGLLDVFGLAAPTAPSRIGDRRTMPAPRGRARQPVPMPQLLAQSAAIRRDARETRQRAEAMRHDDVLRHIRMNTRTEPPSQ